MLEISPNSGNLLDGMTVDGDLTLSASDARFRVDHGLTLNGTLSIGNPSANVYGYVRFLGSSTLAGSGTVVFGQHFINGLWLSGSGTTLPIGPNLTGG